MERYAKVNIFKPPCNYILKKETIGEFFNILKNVFRKLFTIWEFEKSFAIQTFTSKKFTKIGIFTRRDMEDIPQEPSVPDMILCEFNEWRTVN